MKPILVLLIPVLIFSSCNQNSKDKKKVYHVGKNLAEGYQSVTIVYTGNLRQTHHIGILKRV